MLTSIVFRNFLINYSALDFEQSQLRNKSTTLSFDMLSLSVFVAMLHPPNSCAIFRGRSKRFVKIRQNMVTDYGGGGVDYGDRITVTVHQILTTATVC
jgi:hypothetical protein